MAASYLIDTNILIQAIRQRKGRWELLQGLVLGGGSLACSVITTGEIYSGMRAHERDRTLELLAGFDEHAVSGELARYAGLLKNEWRVKGFTLTLADTIIAATAITHKLMLVTENRKDFPMPELVFHELPLS
jgi:predicted nucleic acid-binding protein